MGIYVFDARALQWLPGGDPFQLPELVLRLLAAGERVAAFESDADWFDIGTVGEYERAAADVERFPEKYGLEASAPPPHQVFPSSSHPFHPADRRLANRVRKSAEAENAR